MHDPPPPHAVVAFALVLAALSACDRASTDCAEPDATVAFVNSLGCPELFDALASEPLSATIPGARSVKTVVDRVDDDALYFMNSVLFPTHWEFASSELSGPPHPLVPMIGDFSQTEYSSPSRRFLLGAVTLYEGTGLHAYEIAPYDSATPDMIARAFELIAANGYFADELVFHPTSDAVERAAADLPDAIRVVTTDELFAGVDYQPLNPGTSYGRLRFTSAADLETEATTFRDIVVLDHVPNDIAVVMGIITEQFQTPLSHINVLSHNRGTPNMGLRDAWSDPTLRELDGKWVRLDVSPSAWAVTEVSREQADAWWETNKPAAVGVPQTDLSVTALTDIVQLVDETDAPLKQAIKRATRAFGGKAAHFSVLAATEAVPTPSAFAIPVYHYDQFMRDNGFYERVSALMVDPAFADDPVVRRSQLAQLRRDMEAAPVSGELLAELTDKLMTQYPGTRMRFRSSTNAEDLDGFTGAGLYSSKSGQPGDPERPVEDALRKVWASTWNFRAFEERSFRSIDHLAVGMGILVHRSFPDEEANGVALTNSPFDTSGLESPFYINAQVGEVSVVQPPAGTTSDQFVYYFDRPGQPSVFVARSSLVSTGATVLSRSQTAELGAALTAIRHRFAPAYGTSGGWWAMDVEFKFDGEPGEAPELFIKQARPFAGGRP